MTQSRQRIPRKESASIVERSNILLIMVDQWRGDCLSAAGHSVVETPYLDQLAGAGIRFDRAYSATPSCIPARAGLFTGMSQQRHGRVGYADGIPWEYDHTLAGEFTRGGYETHAIGKMHVYPERNRLGFGSVQLHDGYLRFTRRHQGDLAEVDDYVPFLREQTGRHDVDYAEHGLDANSVVARPWDKPESQHPTNWVADQAVNYLRRRDGDRPFFLFLSFHRPHPPYDPPSWAFDQYRDIPVDVPVGDWADMWAEYGEAHATTSMYLKLPLPRLRRAMAGYYGHMSHIDQQINRVLTTLDELDARNNTWICFTSDHGELMGDHHLFRKSLPYEGSARIPFLLAGPSTGGGAQKAVRDEVVELRDVMPTLLDVAGLPIPESVEGRSLLPFVRGDRTGWRDFLHGEHIVAGSLSVHFLTDGDEKFIWRSSDGREQLFDLRADPQELHDLACEGNSSERLLIWRERLIQRLADRTEGFVAQGKLVPGRKVSPVLPYLRPSR